MFNLADYETVEVRLEKFIKDYPDFRISTELESFQGNRYIVKAYLYKDIKNDVPWTTGYAEETVSERGVNSTSALENCETSAIGRALANAGYAAKGKRPSREEMTKVVAKAPIKPPAQEIKEGDTDYWTTPIGQSMKTVQAPVSLESAMENITAVLGTGEASEAPSCQHGHMKWREGDKNGKAWGGFFCAGGQQTGGVSNCPTKWYVLSASGQWEPQKPRG